MAFTGFTTDFTVTTTRTMPATYFDWLDGKKTPWYPENVYPTMSGVYQTEIIERELRTVVTDGFRPKLFNVPKRLTRGWSFFDANTGCWSTQHDSFEAAVSLSISRHGVRLMSTVRRRWRGITEDENARYLVMSRVLPVSWR